MCRRDPHESLCRSGPESAPPSASSPSRRGSGDNLWLPGLAGHLGATLRDDRRARWGLAVQAQAADHVLQSRAFRLPLLQREETKKKRDMNSSLLVSSTERADVSSLVCVFL